MIKFYSHLKFTVLEIIIIITLFGIVAAIFIPTLINSRERARRTKNISNLKMISNALNMYAMDNNGFLPYAANAQNSRSLFLLLPYTSNKVEVFYPPYIYDEKMSNDTFKEYVADPNTIISSILEGGTDIEPGYAYSPVNNSDRALQIHIISSDYPLVSNFNETYSDDCFVLYADSSVKKLYGEPIE
jgi:type II secretory pathway pseudopilin PulG